MTTQAQNNTQTTFDLHVLGAGYLYRLRKVPVKRGTPYWAVTVGAMHGRRDEGTGRFDVTYIDCQVVGKLAVKRLDELVAAGFFRETGNGKYENEANIFVRFKLGDISPGYFWGKNRETGEPEPVPTIKGRLLQIKSAKVKRPDQEQSFNFEFVNQPQSYNAESAPQQNAESAPQQNAESAPQQNAESGKSLEPIDVKFISDDDPDYVRKITELGSQGYSYDEKRGGFVKLAA